MQNKIHKWTCVNKISLISLGWSTLYMCHGSLTKQVQPQCFTIPRIDHFALFAHDDWKLPGLITHAAVYISCVPPYKNILGCLSYTQKYFQLNFRTPPPPPPQAYVHILVVLHLSLSIGPLVYPSLFNHLNSECWVV